MRNNQPVTQKEYELKDEQILNTRTDLNGVITYANRAFVEASGFSREELIGAPHNIVRHPDMPPEAFANMWQTLQAGESWHGLVKNRRKNGDYYWVDANVTPIMEGGSVVGYASVRLKAERAAVERAEAAYQRIREGKGGVVLARGQIKRSGLLGWLGGFNLRTMRARMIAMMTIAAGLLILTGGLGLYAMDSAGQRVLELRRDGLEDIARLQQIDQLITQGYQSVTSSNPMTVLEGREERAGTVGRLSSNMLELWEAYRAREINHTGIAGEFDQGFNSYVDGLQGMANLLSGGEPFEVYQAVMQRSPELQAAGIKLSAMVSSLVGEKQVLAAALATEAEDMQAKMAMVLAVGAGLGLVLLTLVGVMVIRGLLRAVAELRAFALQIAVGNIGIDAPERRDDELGKLMLSFDVMRRSLGNIVTEVNSGIAVVTPASREIAASNNDLSSHTDQQAAALQETASSMEEMTATVRQNTENARQASGLTSDNAKRARTAGEHMRGVVDSMGRITASSRKMSDIINVIDSIAFQTNILALNASVEAARAGEQGRGFAVVAGEVRNLAGRSANAAKEIRALIDTSSAEIEGGAELIHQAEASIGEVVNATSRVNDIMGEITAASEEQTSGIGQINQAVVEMDKVTQENASRVQSTARAAAALEHQAEQLAIAVAAFRLRGAGASRAGRHHAAVRAGGAAGTAKARPALAAGEAEPGNRRRVRAAAATAAPAAALAAPLGMAASAVDDWEEF